MKSRRRKRTDPKKKIIAITIICLLLWIGAFYIYTTYKNIELEPAKYETTKLLSTRKRTNCGNRRRK